MLPPPFIHFNCVFYNTTFLRLKIIKLIIFNTRGNFIVFPSDTIGCVSKKQTSTYGILWIKKIRAHYDPYLSKICERKKPSFTIWFFDKNVSPIIQGEPRTVLLTTDFSLRNFYTTGVRNSNFFAGNGHKNAGA